MIREEFIKIYNRIRKLQTGSDDEHYILGIDGQTESVFDESGKAKFYNITNGGEIIGRMTPPVNNLTLTNTTLVGNYQASSTITAETNVVVSGTTTLKAGNTIDLKPGFTASNGCNLTINVGTVTSDKYYYLKDHLGSIRVVVDTIGEIVSYDDYDAWGMILNGRSSNFGFADDKYKFTEKERDTETNYDYFGARYYDSELGIWRSVDPLKDKCPGWSPYNYCIDNPLIVIDPDGMEAVDVYPDDPEDRENKKKEKGDILHIGISGSAAYYAWGVNAEIGLVSNLSNGESEFIFRFGQSFGYGSSIGLEATISPDQSLLEYEGKNSFGKEAGENVVEIEAGGKFAGNIMLDPQNKMLPNGGGGSFGFGTGWFVNLTNATYSSGSFNMGNAIRKISENPKSAFWKR